jgi:hypothetical protein
LNSELETTTMRMTAPRTLLRAAVFAAAAASAAALAQATPTGTWHTIDDATGKPRGVIEISEKDGVYSGKLVKSLVPPKARPRCATSAPTRARISRSSA